MPLAVFEKTEVMGVSGWVVWRRQGDRTLFAQLPLLRRVETRQEEILGKVGCGGDADQCMNPLGSRKRREQHVHPPMLEPMRICRPSVSESSTAIASSAQRPIVPRAASPLEAPWPK
jgi:hypothetical protein